MITGKIGFLVGGSMLAGVLAMVGGCQSEVMGSRAALPPVPDNQNVITGMPYEQGQTLRSQRQTYTQAPAPLPQFQTPAPQQPQAPARPTYQAINLGDLPAGPVGTSGRRDGRAPAGNAAGTAVAAGGTYKIVSGDTLGGIAHRHGVKLADLMALNNLNAKSVLRIGQEIKLPANARAAAPAARSERPSSTPAPAGTARTATAGGTYEVVSGDSLALIASRHKIKLAELLAANPNLTTKSVLQIGQKITIPGAAAAATPRPAANVPGGSFGTAPTLPGAAPTLPGTAPAGTPIPAPGQTPAGGSDLPIAAPTLPGANLTPIAPPTTSVPAPGATTQSPATAVPVPIAPPSAGTSATTPPALIDTLLVERDQTIAEFAARHNVSEDVIRQYNAELIRKIPDGILRHGEFVVVPAK